MKRVGIFTAGVLLSMQAWSAPVEVIESAALQKRVERLERMLENPVLLQLSDRLAEQEREIQHLGDQVDRLKWRLKQMEKQRQQEITALQAQIEDLKTQQSKAVPSEVEAEVEALPPAVQPPLQTPDVTAQPEQLLKPADKEVRKAYDQAMTLLRKARYKEAAQAFEAFLKTHGQTQLAPNAAYWAGEAYMAELDYQRAWPYFEQVIQRFPQSNKYDDSLYRGADALYQLGQKDKAIQLRKQLIRADKAEPALKKRAEKQLKAWAAQDGR